MSHGSAFIVKMSDDVHMHLDSALLQPFPDEAHQRTCPSLIDIRKVFIIATYQGFALEHVPVIHNPNTTQHPYNHVYVVKAALTGTNAFRHPDFGSWFIHSFCKEVMENAMNYDLDTLITSVRRLSPMRMIVL